MKLNLKKNKTKNKKVGVHHGKVPKKTNSSITTDIDGVPLAEPPRHKSLLGNLGTPDTQGKAYLEKERVLGQVEILMLKGVITVSHIATTLSIQYITAKKYVEQVHYRWAVLGGAPRMRQVKGESKSRLDLITTELWVLYANSNDERVKATCLNQLMGVHDRKLILDGLTPQTLPLIASEDLHSNSGLSVLDRMKEHKKMVVLADALLTFAGKRKKPAPIEDADFEEIEEPL